MERLTVRKTDIVLFQKDGQYTPPISMNGEQVRKALERLAELEDAIEQGKLVEVVHCKNCEFYGMETYDAFMNCKLSGHARGEKDYCSMAERKEQLICLTEDCPYQTGNPCEAAEGCGGFEGAEESFLMQRFMRVE